MDNETNNNVQPGSGCSSPFSQSFMTSAAQTSKRRDSESTCSSTGSTDTGFLSSPPLEAKETNRHVQLKPDGNKELQVHLDMHEFKPDEIKISKGEAQTAKMCLLKSLSLSYQRKDWWMRSCNSCFGMTPTLNYIIICEGDGLQIYI